MNGLCHVDIRECVVSNRTGTIRFVPAKDSVSHVLQAVEKADEVIEFPCVTLDDSLQGDAPILCKGDVEGHEHAVVECAQALMARGLPLVWQLEVNAHSGGLAEKGSPLAEMLREAGYRFHVYAVDKNVLVEKGEPFGGPNVLAVRGAGEVLHRLNQRTAAR